MEGMSAQVVGPKALNREIALAGFPGQRRLVHDYDSASALADNAIVA
jgi:hypothetical protein